MAPLLLRQIWTLTRKTLIIIGPRSWKFTLWRAFVIPIFVVMYLSFARYLYVPSSTYGISPISPVRSLTDALKSASGSGRNTVAFVNSGHAGGDIDRVIGIVASSARSAGEIVKLLNDESELLATCRSSLRGVTTCYGAAVFYSSPTEGGKWNYTLRGDGSLGIKINAKKTDNEAEVYLLPFQHAIDFAIASIDKTVDQGALPSQVDEYMYTSKTDAQRKEQLRLGFQGTVINVLAPAFAIGVVGLVYQLVGFMASERDRGMSQLIESMMPNVQRWQPQAARLVSYALAFSIIYLPGNVFVGILLHSILFVKTSVAVLLVFYILSALAICSFSVFCASFFRKAQLSGITAVIIALVLAIVAQIVSKSGTGTIAILSLLFAPMNFVFFIIYIARWENKNMPTNLLKATPNSPWQVPGIVLWVFFILQIFIYPILGALVERSSYGTASKGRTVTLKDEEAPTTVQLTNFTKHYRPRWLARLMGIIFRQTPKTVVAVRDLSLTVAKGQIMVLLGANGAGKSTILDAIAGLNQVTSGSIDVDVTGGLGICPQKNVFWDEMTVEEHIRTFNALKAPGQQDTKDQLEKLIVSCDLKDKLKARAKTLSGGQKRKLQLAMMFTGGSRVCCVDEVSGGLDPLSRRKIWDIILAERGTRTFILTTHFLDEADLLADRIAILSQGQLKAEGSTVELKTKLGSGYRVHVYTGISGDSAPPEIEGFSGTVLFDQTVYSCTDSAQVARLLSMLERDGRTDYSVSGPTIEEAFIRVAENGNSETSSETGVGAVGEEVSGKVVSQAVIEKVSSPKAKDTDGINLLTGTQINFARQTWVMFRKRLTILQRSFLPYAAALTVPVIAAGIVSILLKGYTRPGCSRTDQVSISDIANFASQFASFDVVIGPPSQLSGPRFGLLTSLLPGGSSGSGGGANSSTVGFNSSLLEHIHTVNTLDDFNSYIGTNYANVTPGGFFLGGNGVAPTFAYQGNGGIYGAVILQNALDVLLTNVSISTQYAAFDFPWAPGTGKTLQLITYFGLVMSAYPAFFALYPTAERLGNIRSLQYSNGVRAAPLWLAYLTFDSIAVLAVSVLATIIFGAVSSQWFNLGYLFVVFVLYGITSALLSYVISLLAKSQLAAFACSAGGQALMFVIYISVYFDMLVYPPIDKIDASVLIYHFSIAIITPVGNLVRAMFVALNLFSTICHGDPPVVRSYAGDITLYGGPILYLILQSLILFGIILLSDSGMLIFKLKPKHTSPDLENTDTVDKEITDELTRVTSTTDDGLLVLHLNKSFKKNKPVITDLTFGVKKGEVFALLGPNGAGKTTTISLIRGDIPPTSGSILVENIPVLTRRSEARLRLGVCPQFDAMDKMTVVEHLRFYARIRGVTDVEYNVEEIVRAVGLGRFKEKMAGKLSGGNKRKLSLGIALTGNPTVLLLDEPSSSMDPLAKRNMWKALASVVPGRSILLTTHSMEEADALASRAGIMAKRMLALGTTDALRRRFGGRYRVHLVAKSAPHSTHEEMSQLRLKIEEGFLGAEVEGEMWGGQMRFSVPVDSQGVLMPRRRISGDSIEVISEVGESSETTDWSIGKLFALLEERKDDLGVEDYSVSQTTLDQVFLSIVAKHNIEEDMLEAEARAEEKKEKAFGWGGLRRRRSG